SIKQNTRKHTFKGRKERQEPKHAYEEGSNGSGKEEAKEVMVENEVETDEDESDMKLNEMKSTLDDDGAETEREQGNEIAAIDKFL
ncbi:hypothetical protein Avbf_11148, partial [Armadillidium vulgare]